MSGTPSLLSGWKEFIAGELMPGRGTSVDPAKFPDEQFDLYSIPAFDAGVPVTTLGAEIGSSKQVVAEGDVLLSKIVPHIRRAWVVGQNLGRRQIASSEWIVFRSDHADPEYLRHFLVSDRFHAQFMNTVSGVGGSLMRARPAFVAKIPIPLPPLVEQRRIAGILDAADGLRAKRRESIALLDTLTQSIFLDMFGDPMRNPKGLPTAPLNTLVRRITDGTHQSPEWSETGVPFLFVSNIASGRLSYETEKYISEQTHATLTRRCPIELGDVLYSTVGTYGVPVVVEDPRPFAFQRHIAHIKPDPSRIDSHFLKVMLASPGVKAQADSQARGVAQKTVNLGSIQEFVVFDLPLAEQLSASEIFSTIERERERQVASLFALGLLFASLQSRAFHGDL